MSVQPTEIPGLADQTSPVPDPPASEPGTEQRNAFMAALAAAETAISSSPVLPNGIQIHCPSWDVSGVRVEPYFHLDPDGVRAFAEHIGGVVTERSHADGSPLTEARGVVAGMPFRAWALLDAPVAAEAEQGPVTA